MSLRSDVEQFFKTATDRALAAVDAGQDMDVVFVTLNRTAGTIEIASNSGPDELDAIVDDRAVAILASALEALLLREPSVQRTEANDGAPGV